MNPTHLPFSLFFLFFIPILSIGQEKSDFLLDTNQLSKQKSHIVFEFSVENGGILASKEIKHSTFEDAYYNAINLRVGWRTQKSKDIYHQLYHYPTYGIGLYSSTFNSHIIGKPYALYGFITAPIAAKKEKRWRYTYRIGLGLSGNFNPYDEQENPLNLVIGSKNNVFIDLGFRGEYRLNPHIDLGVGTAFHHFSNGALRLPNMGVNLLPITVAVTYTPNPNPRDLSYQDLPPLDSKWLYHINLAGGVKQVEQEIQQRYFKSTLSLDASKPVSYKWQIGGGLDLFYSESGNIEAIAGDEKGKLASLFSLGTNFYIAHILNERLILNGNVGYYLHRNHFNGEIKNTYLRAGARYYVYKNFNAGISIKAHTGKADYIEWTTGYTFRKK